MTLPCGGTALSADDIVLFAPGSISAEPVWGLTFLAGASAGDARLVDLLFTPWNGEFGHGAFGGVAISRKIARLYDHFAFEGEIGLGARFGENGGGEGWAAIYLRYEGFPWDNLIRTTVGISTGLDYLSNPEFEEHVLHYLGPELTFALPRHPNTELVFRYHHRSGAFGTFGGVLEGSNIVTLGLRLRR